LEIPEEKKSIRTILDRAWENQDLLIRVGVIAGLLGFMVYRMIYFDRFPGTWESTLRHFRFQAILSEDQIATTARIQLFWAIRLLLWTLESVNLVAYVISYWTRIPSINRSEGFMETVYPFAVSGIPFVMVLFRERLFFSALTRSSFFALYLGILILMSAGSLVSLLGVMHLRRSFAIRVEARALVQSGPYRWIRHPIYLGYFITFLGSCILHFNGLTAALYAIFILAQIARARLEEEKLVESFPAYAAYQERTGMFVPRMVSSGSFLHKVIL